MGAIGSLAQVPATVQASLHSYWRCVNYSKIGSTSPPLLLQRGEEMPNDIGWNKWWRLLELEVGAQKSLCSKVHSSFCGLPFYHWWRGGWGNSTRMPPFPRPSHGHMFLQVAPHTNLRVAKKELFRVLRTEFLDAMPKSLADAWMRHGAHYMVHHKGAHLASTIVQSATFRILFTISARWGISTSLWIRSTTFSQSSD